MNTKNKIQNGTLSENGSMGSDCEIGLSERNRKRIWNDGVCHIPHARNWVNVSLDLEQHRGLVSGWVNANVRLGGMCHAVHDLPHGHRIDHRGLPREKHYTGVRRCPFFACRGGVRASVSVNESVTLNGRGHSCGLGEENGIWSGIGWGGLRVRL